MPPETENFHPVDTTTEKTRDSVNHQEVAEGMQRAKELHDRGDHEAEGQSERAQQEVEASGEWPPSGPRSHMDASESSYRDLITKLSKVPLTPDALDPLFQEAKIQVSGEMDWKFGNTARNIKHVKQLLEKGQKDEVILRKILMSEQIALGYLEDGALQIGDKSTVVMSIQDYFLDPTRPISVDAIVALIEASRNFDDGRINIKRLASFFGTDNRDDFEDLIDFVSSDKRFSLYNREFRVLGTRNTEINQKLAQTSYNAETFQLSFSHTLKVLAEHKVQYTPEQVQEFFSEKNPNRDICSIFGALDIYEKGGVPLANELRKALMNDLELLKQKKKQEVIQANESLKKTDDNKVGDLLDIFGGGTPQGLSRDAMIASISPEQAKVLLESIKQKYPDFLTRFQEGSKGRTMLSILEGKTIVTNTASEQGKLTAQAQIQKQVLQSVGGTNNQELAHAIREKMDSQAGKKLLDASGELMKSEEDTKLSGELIMGDREMNGALAQALLAVGLPNTGGIKQLDPVGISRIVGYLRGLPTRTPAQESLLASLAGIYANQKKKVESIQTVIELNGGNINTSLQYLQSFSENIPQTNLGIDSIAELQKYTPAGIDGKGGGSYAREYGVRGGSVENTGGGIYLSPQEIRQQYPSLASQTSLMEKYRFEGDADTGALIMTDPRSKNIILKIDQKEINGITPIIASLDELGLDSLIPSLYMIRRGFEAHGNTERYQSLDATHSDPRVEMEFIRYTFSTLLPDFPSKNLRAENLESLKSQILSVAPGQDREHLMERGLQQNGIMQDDRSINTTALEQRLRIPHV